MQGGDKGSGPAGSLPAGSAAMSPARPADKGAAAPAGVRGRGHRDAQGAATLTRRDERSMSTRLFAGESFAIFPGRRPESDKPRRSGAPRRRGAGRTGKAAAGVGAAPPRSAAGAGRGAHTMARRPSAPHPTPRASPAASDPGARPLVRARPPARPPRRSGPELGPRRRRRVRRASARPRDKDAAGGGGGGGDAGQRPALLRRSERLPPPPPPPPLAGKAGGTRLSPSPAPAPREYSAGVGLEQWRGGGDLRGTAAGPWVGLGSLRGLPGGGAGLEGTPLPLLTMNGELRGAPRPRGHGPTPRRGKGVPERATGPTSVPTHLSRFPPPPPIGRGAPRFPFPHRVFLSFLFSRLDL